MNTSIGIGIAQYTAFAYGLIHLIWLNAKILRRTRQNIQEDDLRKREQYSAHGLRIAFIRIFALLIIMFITHNHIIS